MNEEILKNIWNYLSTQGLTSSPFDEWSVNIQQDEGVQKNIHGSLVNQNLTDSNFDIWANNLGLKKRRIRYGFRIGNCISVPSALSNAS